MSIPRLHRDTIPDGPRTYTLVGQPAPLHLPAADAPRASYVDRYPPEFDEFDTVVVDVEIDPVGRCTLTRQP